MSATAPESQVLDTPDTLVSQDTEQRIASQTVNDEMVYPHIFEPLIWALPPSKPHCQGLDAHRT